MSLGSTRKSKLKHKETGNTADYELEIGKDTAVATLHFKKGNDSNMYFFNRYQVQLNNDKQDVNATQMFYINKGSSITLKEGYNLLAGRAVHKTLTNKKNEKYGAWVQLDFKNTTANGNYQMKQFHQNYGYDLEKVLAKYLIKELSDEQSKKQLVSSIERGNL